MKTATKPPAKRRVSAHKHLSSQSGATISGTESVDWEMRIEPPPAGVRTLTARFLQAGDEPPVIRHDPRE